MTGFFLLFLSIVISFSGLSQKSSCVPRAYAYSREVLTGAAPTVIIDWQGNTHEEPVKPVMQYFIFAEVVPGCPVSVKNVWINRTLYAIRVEAVKATPVTLTDNSMVQKPEPDVLVPETRNAVIQVRAGAASGARVAIPAHLQKVKNPSEVIIEYAYKGKLYYHIITPINRLDPLAAQ